MLVLLLFFLFVHICTCHLPREESTQMDDANKKTDVHMYSLYTAVNSEKLVGDPVRSLLTICT